MSKVLFIAILALCGCVISRAATVQTKGAYVPPVRIVFGTNIYSVTVEQMWSRKQLTRALIFTNDQLQVSAAGKFTPVRYTMLRGSVTSPRDYAQYLLTDLRGTKISPHTKYYVRPDLYRSPPNPAAGQPKSLVKSAMPFIPPLLWLTWEQQSGVTLLWNRNPENNVIGYRVYKGAVPRGYDSVVDVGNEISARISDIAWGDKDYFAVTAYDSDGLESGYSAEVVYTAPLVAPWHVRLVRTEPTINPVGRFVIESKASIDQPWAVWKTVTNSFFTVTGTGYYRVGKLP